MNKELVKLAYFLGYGVGKERMTKAAQGRLRLLRPVSRLWQLLSGSKLRALRNTAASLPGRINQAHSAVHDGQALSAFVNAMRNKGRFVSGAAIRKLPQFSKLTDEQFRSFWQQARRMNLKARQQLMDQIAAESAKVQRLTGASADVANRMASESGKVMAARIGAPVALGGAVLGTNALLGKNDHEAVHSAPVYGPTYITP